MLRLIGHSNPLGVYPAVVFPVGHDAVGDLWVDVGEDEVQLLPVQKEGDLVRFEGKEMALSANYDFRRDGLFAVKKNQILPYKRFEKASFFTGIYDEFLKIDPFLCLDIAVEHIGEPPAIRSALSECASAFRTHGGENAFGQRWYESFCARHKSILKMLELHLPSIFWDFNAAGEAEAGPQADEEEEEGPAVLETTY
ncbi:MAG: hypothetical protein DWQ01_22335 [Planctomycetota bacterium]|nr:MAG: hypothetical protein DWQ01_22335 [Planctomycetota bacterium]